MKPIEGYPNYSITDDGRVWSKSRRVKRKDKLFYFRKEKWLKPTLNKFGYLEINLYKNGKRKTFKIHRLVAQQFIPNLENKLEVNHINGVKTDNRVENLEWVTHRENHVHAWKIGLFDNKDYEHTRGENHGRAKLTWDQVNEIRTNHISKGVYARKPWEKYGIGRTQYYNTLSGMCWKDTRIGN